MLYSSSVKKLRCYPNSKFLNRTTGPEIFENQNPNRKKMPVEIGTGSLTKHLLKGAKKTQNK